MKEIISPGYGFINIKYNNICPYCGCQYIYQNEDTYTNYNLTGIGKMVLCPCCGKENMTSNFSFNCNIKDAIEQLKIEYIDNLYEQKEQES